MSDIGTISAGAGFAAGTSAAKAVGTFRLDKPELRIARIAALGALFKGLGTLLSSLLEWWRYFTEP
jgi:hypothetical protein